MKNNFLSKIFGKSKDYYEENTWNDMQSSLGHAFGEQNYTKTELLKQYQKSLYVFRAVEITADRISSIDLELIRVVNSFGEIEVLNNHEVYNLLKNPNPDQTWSSLVKITVMHLKLAGEAFWYKIRDSRGNVIELIPLQTQYVTKVISKETGKIVRVNLKVGPVDVNLDFNDIVYFHNPSPLNHFDGQATLLPVMTRVETEREASSYQANFFKNNAEANAILSTDQKLTDDQKAFIKKSWDTAFKGGKNFGKTALLEAGLKYEKLAITQKEMDFIESMKFTREDILIAFGIPKGVLLSEDSNNADGQNAMRSFLENTIEPLMRMIVETINIQLIRPDFEFDLILTYKNPVEEDRLAVVNEIKELVDIVITRNEARTKLGMDAIGTEGDVLFNSFTKQPLETSVKPKTIDKSVFIGNDYMYQRLKMNDDIKSFMKMAKENKKKKKTPQTIEKTDDVKKYTSLFIGEQRDMYKKVMLKQLDEKELIFSSQLNDFTKKRQDVALDGLANTDGKTTEIIDEEEQKRDWEVFLLPLMLEIGKELGQNTTDLIAEGVTYEISKDVAEEIAKESVTAVQSITKTTNEALKNTLQAGIDAGEGINQLSERVAEIYSEFPQYRSDLIARTETTYLNGRNSIDAYKQNGIKAKEWISTHDSNVREDHLQLDGEIVPIDKNFSDGSFAPPKQSSPYNCRCVVAGAIEE